MENLLSKEKLYLFLGVFLTVCLIVIVAIMLDLWDGVHTAKKTNQKVHSHKLRVTISKMSEYFRFMMIGFLVDCIGMLFSFYALPFVVLVFGVGLIIVEAKSMFEHASRRKSHARKLPQIIQSIIDCAQDKDAHKIIDEIANLNTATK